jgi:hypothetical protein
MHEQQEALARRLARSIELSTQPFERGDLLMDDETIAMAIQHFFDWFRERHTSIERLSRVTMPPGMEELPLNLLPDQAVLISAGIDSLAPDFETAGPFSGVRGPGIG